MPDVTDRHGVNLKMAGNGVVSVLVCLGNRRVRPVDVHDRPSTTVAHLFCEQASIVSDFFGSSPRQPTFLLQNDPIPWAVFLKDLFEFATAVMIVKARARPRDHGNF